MFRWPTLQSSWLLMRQPPHQLGSPDLAAIDKHPFQPKPKHFNGGTKQNTSPLDGPQKGPALLTHTEQKHSHIFKLGLYRQKEPWYLMYILRLHTQNLSHNTSGQASIVQNCLPFPLSTSAWCWVLSEKGGTIGPQDIYTDFLGLTPARHKGTGHHQVNDPGTSYITSTFLDIISALLLYKKHGN